MPLIALLLAWIYGHILEYVLHRYVLHPMGMLRSKTGQHVHTPLDFHWKEHHRQARKLSMMDGSSWKESMALGFLLLLHLPLVWFMPWFYAGLIASSLHYLYVHGKAHTRYGWAMRHVPWHYTHHMGKDQNSNWGVRSDMIDRIVGTRTDLDGKKRL